MKGIKLEKILIILGADGNLGKGISDVLVKKSFNKILLFGKTKPDATFQSNTVFNVVNDLSDEAEIKTIFTNIGPSMGKLFFLYSTIGGYTGGKNVWEINYNDWKKMFALNLNISFLIAKHFSLLIKEAAGGSICFTSAYTSLKAENKKSAYGASKAALNYLVKTLALEGKEINMSANAIAPFILDTEENRSWVPDKTNLIKLDEIGELIFNLFENYKIVSGNIIELPYNLAV